MTLKLKQHTFKNGLSSKKESPFFYVITKNETKHGGRKLGGI